MVRFNMHFINDDPNELQFAFDFEFPNPGYVGLAGNSTVYIELDGITNNTEICDFDPKKEYLKYQDFKHNCVSREIQINLLSGEYISEVEYSNDKSILATVRSKSDITVSRKIWSYIGSNLAPTFDFQNNYYMQMADEILEFKQQINTVEDLEVSSYLAKSTSYFLVLENSDI